MTLHREDDTFSVSSMFGLQPEAVSMLFTRAIGCARTYEENAILPVRDNSNVHSAPDIDPTLSAKLPEDVDTCTCTFPVMMPSGTSGIW